MLVLAAAQVDVGHLLEAGSQGGRGGGMLQAMAPLTGGADDATQLGKVQAVFQRWLESKGPIVGQKALTVAQALRDPGLAYARSAAVADLAPEIAAAR